MFSEEGERGGDGEGLMGIITRVFLSSSWYGVTVRSERERALGKVSSYTRDGGGRDSL